MSRRILAGSFAHEQDVLLATEVARKRGWRILDVHTPYPVHGLDRAMGLAPSRLGLVAFLLGALGTALALWFQSWTSAVSWPLNVGGRPLRSWPAFVPVAFEVMVLSAGLGVVLALLVRCKLFPGKRPTRPLSGVSDDRFVLLLEEADAAFDAAGVRRVLLECGAVAVEEWEEGP
jgi:hypothetical protein